MPAWITPVITRGSFASGISRLWADHILSCRLVSKYKIDLIHFPKGWIPLFPIPRAKIVATVHDAIDLYLEENYRRQVPWIRRRYFAWTRRFALKHADHIITVSNFSKGALLNLLPEARTKISVIYSGPGMMIFPAGKIAREEKILVIGSRMPHKATAETIRLLEYFGQKSYQRLKVVVVGISRWDTNWGAYPTGVDLVFYGSVSDRQLSRFMQTCKALVFLSEIEGFGFPPLESYRAGMPVCYRDSTAVGEVMNGAPGGWDGTGENGFCAALDEVWALSDSQVLKIRSDLMKRFDWAVTAEKTITIYQNVLTAAETTAVKKQYDYDSS